MSANNRNNDKRRTNKRRKPSPLIAIELYEFTGLERLIWDVDVDFPGFKYDHEDLSKLLVSKISELFDEILEWKEDDNLSFDQCFGWELNAINRTFTSQGRRDKYALVWGDHIPNTEYFLSRLFVALINQKRFNDTKLFMSYFESHKYIELMLILYSPLDDFKQIADSLSDFPLRVPSDIYSDLVVLRRNFMDESRSLSILKLLIQRCPAVLYRNDFVYAFAKMPFFLLLINYMIRVESNSYDRMIRLFKFCSCVLKRSKRSVYALRDHLSNLGVIPFNLFERYVEPYIPDVMDLQVFPTERKPIIHYFLKLCCLEKNEIDDRHQIQILGVLLDLCGPLTLLTKDHDGLNAYEYAKYLKETGLKLLHFDLRGSIHYQVIELQDEVIELLSPSRACPALEDK